jgi:hypothetical protein
MHHRGKARFALHGVNWDASDNHHIPSLVKHGVQPLALPSLERPLCLAKHGATTLPR